MPDSLMQFKWQVRDFERALERLPTDKATQQALRKATRRFVQVARREAPVGGQDDPNRGTLKRSVHQSRRIIKRGVGQFSIYAGPMGGRANLYRGKAELQRGFVATAYRDAMVSAREAFEETYAQVLKRGRL